MAATADEAFRGIEGLVPTHRRLVAKAECRPGVMGAAAGLARLAEARKHYRGVPVSSWNDLFGGRFPSFYREPARAAR